MFQDVEGTVPVTAVEQPVGLMLDKSKGLVLGPELVTNGTFDTDAAGWTADASVNQSVVSNRLKLEAISGIDNFHTEQTISGLVVGKYYALTATVESASGNSAVRARVRLPIGLRIQADVAGVPKTQTVYFIATATSVTLQLGVASASSWGAVGDVAYFDNISVREISGNHASQPTATSRPLLRQDGNGKHYLYFDGVDDFLVTPTITPGIDKVQVFAGVRRLRHNLAEIIVETGISSASIGAFYFAAEPTDQRYAYSGRGNRATSSQDIAGANFFPSPDTAILTATQDINGNTPAQMRRNGGVWANSTNTTFGTGNFLAYPLYIGRRAGLSLPFKGHIYNMIVRFGSNLPIETIEQVEAWINGKTGAY